MKKRKANKYYEFKSVKVTYGSATYSIDGKAKYEIVDNGIGSYEYWGSKETNHDYIAEFTDVEIEDIKLEDSLEYGTQHLSVIDKFNIGELVLSALSEDTQLCISLTENY